MEPFSNRWSFVRMLVVVVLVCGMIGGGVVAGIDGASTAAAQPEVPDPESEIEDAPAQGQDEDDEDDDDGESDGEEGNSDAADEDEGGSDIPVNPDDAASDGADDDEGAGADTGGPAGPDADAEGDGEGEDDTPEPPPEGVSAGEYYEDEQLDEWQEMADDTAAIGDVRELEAQEAHDIFVEDEDSNAFGDRIETDQVGGPTQDNPEGGTPTAADLLEGGAAWFAEAAAGLVELVFEGTIEIVVGTPTPENAGWLGIFGEPTNEPFAALFADLHETWLFPLTLSFFVLAMLGGASILPFSGLVGKYSASKWVAVAFVTVLAISLSWPVVTAMHATADAVALSIAPSEEELTNTEGLATLAAAAGPAAAALYVGLGMKMIVYAFLFGMRYFLLLMILPYTFGLAIAIALFAPWRTLRKLASAALWLHASLLVIPIVVAILFRSAYLVDWSFGAEGLVNLLLIMGLLVATIAIPIWMMYKATTMTGMLSSAVGGAGASLAARSSYTPKSIGYARSAGSKSISGAQAVQSAPDSARAMGKSARAMPSRMADRASALRSGDFDALRISYSSPSSSSSSSSDSSSSSASTSTSVSGSGSGGTQADRKKAATDGGTNTGSFRSLSEIFKERNQTTPNTRNHSPGGAD